MKTLTYQLRDLKKLMICIGFEDENNRTQVRIDCGEVFSEYPNAAVSMKVQAPKGGIYPATVTREGNMIMWTVRDCDVANKGSGEFQLTFTDGTTVIKTCVGRFHVDRSLKGSGTAPSGVQDWLENAEKVLEQVESAEIHQPMIGLDGYWYTWDKENGEYVKTDTKAQGEDGDPGQPGTDATPDLITVPYEDLTFPVAAGTQCYHGGKLYEANQAIQTSEQWNAAHWTETTVEGQLGQLKSALTKEENINKAIVSVFQHVAFKDDDGATAYNALYALVYETPLHELVSISASFNSSVIVYAWEDLDTLKANLTVSAIYSDSETPVVITTGYTLSGSLSAGNNTITVTYGEKTATFTVFAYDFAFTAGYVNSTNNSTQKKVQIKENSARLLCDGAVGDVPFNDDSGQATAFYPMPIRSGINRIKTYYANGYRRSVVIFAWSESLEDFVQVYGSGWGNTHEDILLDKTYRDGNYYIGATFSGANGTENMSNVDTSEWKVTLYTSNQ